MRTRRTISSLILAAVGLVAVALRAEAAVPNPVTSTVDPCVRICPAGDLNFHVVVRDANSNPVAGSTVVVDFTSCPGIVLCPLIGSEPYLVGPGSAVRMVTNAAGIVDFPIRAGGICAGPARVFADGVMLASNLPVPSPDQNGDAIVNATDQGILAVKLGGAYDATADLNCNTTMGADDSAELDRHFGHSCGAVVPVSPRSWGRVKILYR